MHVEHLRLILLSFFYNFFHSITCGIGTAIFFNSLVILESFDENLIRKQPNSILCVLARPKILLKLVSQTLLDLHTNFQTYNMF